MPRKGEIQGEENSVATSLRRSSRISVNSPAPSSKKNLRPDAEGVKTESSSLTRENPENDEIKENKPALRSRRASTTKEEIAEKREPAITRSRRSSVTIETTVKEEEKREIVTRRRRLSATEELPKPEVTKPVKSRRGSLTDKPEDVAKKPTTRRSVKEEEIEQETLRKPLRSRRTSMDKIEGIAEIAVKERRSTRGRRASTDLLEDDLETKAVKLTPSKSRHRLSIAETASLEPIEEQESETKSKKSSPLVLPELKVVLTPSPVKSETSEKVETSPQDETKSTKSTPIKARKRLSLIDNPVHLEPVEEVELDSKSNSPIEKDMRIVVDLQPLKKGKPKEMKTNFDLSAIDESSFTEDKEITPAESEDQNKKSNETSKPIEDTNEISKGEDSAIKDVMDRETIKDESSVDVGEQPLTIEKLLEQNRQSPTDKISKSIEEQSMIAKGKISRMQGIIDREKIEEVTSTEVVNEQALAQEVNGIEDTKDEKVLNSDSIEKVMSEEHVTEESVSTKSTAPKASESTDKREQKSVSEISSLKELTEEENKKINTALRLKEENAQALSNEYNATETIVDSNPKTPDDSSRFHLNVSLPSTNSKNINQDEDIEDNDALNISKTSNSSDKENIETNLPEDMIVKRHILENKEEVKENMINTKTYENYKETKVQSTVAAARVSDVFRPKMVENSFLEPMDVDEFPSILGTTQNKLSLELDERNVKDIPTAESTPVIKESVRNFEYDICIKSEEQMEPSTKDLKDTESDSIGDSFKLCLSVNHTSLLSESKNKLQIEGSTGEDLETSITKEMPKKARVMGKSNNNVDTLTEAENMKDELQDNPLSKQKTEELQIVKEVQAESVEALELEQNKSSMSPQFTSKMDKLEVKENDPSYNPEGLEKRVILQPESPQHVLDDEINLSVENLDEEIDQATEDRLLQETTDTEITEHSELQQTKESKEATENTDVESHETKESRNGKSVSPSSEETVSTATSPCKSLSPVLNVTDIKKKSENQISTTEQQIPVAEDLDVGLEQSLNKSEHSQPDLGSQFTKDEESEDMASRILKEERHHKNSVEEIQEESLKMSTSDPLENTNLELENKEEIQVTSRSSTESNSPTSIEVFTESTHFEKKSDSCVVMHECTKEGTQLTKSEGSKDTCLSDDYEFNVPSDDEEAEKTQLKLEQESIQNERHLQSLEDTSEVEIADSREAQSKTPASPLKRKVVTAEDGSSKKIIISPRRSEDNLTEKMVTKEEFSVKCSHTVECKMSDTVVDREQKSLNDSYIMEEKTARLETYEKNDTLEDISSDKLNKSIVKETCREEIQEIKETTKCGVNEVINIQRKTEIDDTVTSSEKYYEDLTSMDDANIKENEICANDCNTQELTSISSQTKLFVSTTEHAETDYEEMEFDFKDTIQNSQEQKTGKEETTTPKKTLLKKTEESSKMLSSSRKSPLFAEKEAAEEIHPSEKLNQSNDAKQKDVNVSKGTEKKTKKKRKKNKRHASITSSIDIAHRSKEEETEESSCDLEQVKDDSKRSHDIANQTISVDTVMGTSEAEDNEIKIDVQTIEKKGKSSKKNHKKSKPTLKETAEGDSFVETTKPKLSVMIDNATEEDNGEVTRSKKKSKKSKTKKGVNKEVDETATEYIKKKNKKFSAVTHDKEDITDTSDEAVITEEDVDEEKVDSEENVTSYATIKDEHTESDEIEEKYKDTDEQEGEKIILDKCEEVNGEKFKNPRKKWHKFSSAREDQTEKDSQGTSKKFAGKSPANELEKKQFNKSIESYEDSNGEVSNSERKPRKRKADEGTHLESQHKSTENLQKKKRKIENDTEVDSNNDVILQEPVKLTALKEFSTSKLDEYLSKKFAEMETEEEEEASYTDISEEEEEEENEFINSMAEEGEEDTPSEDSNEIIDEGEAINTTESETDSEDDYDEDDSFICDEEIEELLSGDEYDLGDDKKKTKSRIIPLDNYESDVIKVERKKKPIKKKKSRIITISDSSDSEDDKENSQMDEKEKHEETVKPAALFTNKSSFDEDESYAEEKPGDITLEESSPAQSPKQPVKLDTISSEEIKTGSKKRNSSIIIHENINVSEIKDVALSERISSLVDSFCTSIRKGEISMNLSLEYAPKGGSEESPPEDDDVFIKDTKKTKKSKTSKVSARKSSSGSSFRYKSKELPEEWNSKGDIAIPSQFQPTKSSSSDSSLNDSHDENDTEKEMSSKKAKRLSVSLVDTEDSDSEKRSRKKRKFSRSLEDLHKNTIKKKKIDKPSVKASKDVDLKRKIKNPKRAEKIKKLSLENDLRTQSLSIMNQLITDVKNRPIRTIKPSRNASDLNSSWITEIADVRPSTSLTKKDITEYKSGKVHPKDFRTQMLYNPSRVRRVDTKTLLKKKGAYF